MSVRALVVGAGPAGLGAAAALAGWARSVTVIEARPRGRRRVVGEHLPPAGVAAVARLGLGEALNDPAHGESCGVRSLWGEGPAAERDYFFSGPGRGLNLSRSTFDAALARGAEQRGARLLYGFRLRDLVPTSTGYVATATGEEASRRFKVEVVIDASGRAAAAARRLGGVRRRSERTLGLVGRVEGVPPRPDGGRLLVESAEDGWWYGVRLADGGVVAAFLTDPETARAHSWSAAELWRDRLRRSALVGALTEGGRLPAEVAVFDASAQWLAPAEAESFLAVGDAAAAFDPLSSQGVAKALGDGVAAVKALRRHVEGEAGALPRHRAAEAQALARHRIRRAEVYRAETRWTDALFWHVRRAAPQPGP